MSLNANNVKTESRNKQPIIEAGVYPGRLVQVIDLGLQPQNPYKGKDKPPAYEVMATYELVDVFMVDENGKEDETKPRWISETFPMYGLVADRATSTKRYEAFDPKHDFGGDWSQCVSLPANITLINNPGKDGKIYTNVAAVSQMRPRDVANCPELKNPTKVFDLDNPDIGVFESLPNWIQDKIKSNLNFNGSQLKALLTNSTAIAKNEVKKSEPETPPPQQNDVNEDLPY